MIDKYLLEFILHAHNSSAEKIKVSLAEFADHLEVRLADELKGGNDFKISLKSQDPTLVFDICSQLGRIKSVKINEE